MTTVVYRDGVIAADGRVTSQSGSILFTNYNKVYRLKDGSIAGASGYASNIRKYLAWLDNPVGDRPSLGSGDNCTTIIVIRPNRRLEEHDWEGIDEHNRVKFYAMGSGRAAAYGALHMGASARQAVVAACKVDPFSGGRIRTLKL